MPIRIVITEQLTNDSSIVGMKKTMVDSFLQTKQQKQDVRHGTSYTSYVAIYRLFYFVTITAINMKLNTDY
jgi:hypothetical protein